ncbi:MAG: hypothetical protein RI894_163 [Bacteroidota bacterium]|jgi:hypothetical protein
MFPIKRVAFFYISLCGIFFCGNFCGNNALFAQSETVSSAELSLGIGQIYKHTPNFKAPIRGITSLTELSYEWQTAGAESWHTTHRYPIIGAHLIYADFGDPDIFGQAIGVFPSLSFSNRWRGRRFYSFFRLGFGLAYLTKYYNAVSNPLNNAIGRDWNNVTAARAGVGFRLTPNLELMAGGSFTHFSNGSSQLPNLGINALAPFLSLRYTPKAIGKYAENKAFLKNPRWHGLFSANYAVEEAIAFGGPRYAYLIGTAGAMYDLNITHHLFALAEYEFSESRYKWARNVMPEHLSEELAINYGSRYSVEVGDEFQFGQFAFSTSVGVYLVSGTNAPPVYEKISWRYYFLPEKTTQPFLNIYLKAHDISAVYFGFGGGLRF